MKMIVGTVVCLFIGLASEEVFARGSVRLIDIGVIGLSSHDLISWDREKQELSDTKGRLDLSSIFDWTDERTGQNRWTRGGDPKNSENAVVFSVAQQLIHYYAVHRQFLEAGGMPTGEAHTKSRKKTVQYYHRMVKVSFERLFGLPFPEPGLGGDVTDEEHAAMRAARHILPGKVQMSFGPQQREVALTDFRYAQMNLPLIDLMQFIPGFNGQYDEEYLNFSIPFGPRTGEKINFYEVDRDFVESRTSYDFDEMLRELRERGSFEGVSFARHIRSLYSKGLSPDNQWLSH